MDVVASRSDLGSLAARFDIFTFLIVPFWPRLPGGQVWAVPKEMMAEAHPSSIRWHPHVQPLALASFNLMEIIARL